MISKLYNEKLTSAKEAIESIDDNSKVCIAMAACQPPALTEQLANAIKNDILKHSEIYYKLAMQPVGENIINTEVATKAYLNTFFMTKYDRDALKNGINNEKNNLNYIPYHFSELPKIATEIIKIDVLLVSVSPMDKHGYFTFSLNNDFTSTVARKCKKLIIEVNENLPKVYGDSAIHISEVDSIVENNAPLLLVPRGKIDDKQKVIGKKIASLIDDCSTIQLGIGGISDAICEGLSHHKDLGIHTELLSPAMMDLVKKGIVTGTKKNIHSRKAVFTVAMGDAQFCKDLHDNPTFESYPSSYINSPHIIGQNDNFVSVNSAVEIDIFGNVNAEFLSEHQFSGTGGHADFVRGSFLSKNGKSIIAMTSTTNSGASKIVSHVQMTTTSKMDVDYIVTEYGIERLRGKNMSERVSATIRLAHPDHRDNLRKIAKERNLI